MSTTVVHSKTSQPESAKSTRVSPISVFRTLPVWLFHTIVRWLLRLCFRVEVRGLENYYKARQRKVVIANHTSFLDAALLSTFLPERPTFAVDSHMSKRWWVRPFLWTADIRPLDTYNPMAVRALTRLARDGVPIVIFPEGRLTATGALMKVYEGAGMVAAKADADLVPVQIDGAQYSPFSRLRGKVRQRLFPRITLTVRSPQNSILAESLRGRDLRQHMADSLYELLASMNVASADTDRTLFESLVDAAKIHGAGFEILSDSNAEPMTYRRLIASSLFLGKHLSAGTAATDTIGLIIANSSAAVAAFFGIQSRGRVCGMLNYSAGPANVVSACRTACIRKVWTSRRFVEAAKLETLVGALERAGVRVCFLEDIRRNPVQVAMALMRSVFFPTPGRPKSTEQRRKASDEPAVIMFTSGSSGRPKAVVLSHKNLLTNRQQLCARIDFNRRDRVFNCLPIFHAFGLTGGTIIPLLSGIPVFMYPTPLHYRAIPEIIYRTNSTILFGTNSFLAGYARRAHAYDFFSVRYAFAGAEKLQEKTRRIYAEQFGVRILEGYGATETSPALTLNTPMFNKPGSVGRFLPGIEWRLDSVPGLARGGRLWVRGGNIMRGYFRADKPGQLEAPKQGWYDTGDIVEVDTNGFVKILGRAKRFAKIGGEMVSLAATEELASAVCSEAVHAAITRPHPQKGEEIILVTDQRDARRSSLVAFARRNGLSELCIPRTILKWTSVPVLGSGKPYYVAIENRVKIHSSHVRNRKPPIAAPLEVSVCGAAT